MDCMWESVAFLHEINVVSHSVHCNHILHAPIAPSRPSLENVSTNDDGRVQGHLRELNYTQAAQLFHAAVRDHAYSTVRSLTHTKPHLYVRADHLKIPDCLVFMFSALLATFLFHSPRRTLDVAVQTLPRVVFKSVEKPPPGFGHVYLSFCGVLRAGLRL